MYQYKNALVVTPHDTDLLGVPAKHLCAAGAGNITCITEGGQTVVIPIAANGDLPIATKVIKATGTTATGIVVLY